MTTTVINLKSGKPYDVYIGRGACPRTGILSPWGNPYSHLINSIARFHTNTRNEAIAAYAHYIEQQPDLMSRILTLRDKVLACWCEPDLCHGRILAALADSLQIRVVTPAQFAEGFAVLTGHADDYVKCERRMYTQLYRTSGGNYVVSCS